MTKFDKFDFLDNPLISEVTYGLEGKVFTFMGGNSTGKTYQATRFPKPFVLG